MRRLFLTFSLLTLTVLPAWSRDCPIGYTCAGLLNAQSTNCSNSSACLSLPLPADVGSIMVTVGGTFAATVEFEQSADGGTTWASVNGAVQPSGATQTATTTTGVWRFGVGGATNFRLRCSAYASGAANTRIQASKASPASASINGAGTQGVQSVAGAYGPDIGFTVGRDGLDFNILTDINNVLFNLPDAACVARGVINNVAQVFCGVKTFQDDLITNGEFTAGGGTVTQMGTDCSLVEPLPGASISCYDANTNLYYLSLNGGAMQVLNLNPVTVQNGLISGGSVAYTGSGLVFTVQSAVYSIGGVQFTSPQGDITLDAADGANPRIDVIAVDNTGTVVKITGTPAGSPSEPSTDPTTQVKLTTVYVAALATTPSNVTTTNIYLENTEWTTARSPATDPPWNLASTNNPYAGTKDVEATTAASGNYITFTNGAPVTLTSYNVLVFYIRSKALWNNKRSLTLQWLSGTTPVSQGLVLKDGTFGFNSGTTTSYQQIAIPISQFAPTSTATVLKMTVTGTGTSTIGFYLDNVILQGGVSQPTLPTGIMIWKGTYSATNTYAPNDVVQSGGATYLALTTNTAVTPASGANWAAIGGSPVTYVDNEVPSGAINGANQTYTLANAPSPATSLICSGNGVRWQAGGVDFTLSAGTTITTVGTLQTGDKGIVCSYRY